MTEPKKQIGGQPGLVPAALFGLCPQCGAKTLFEGVAQEIATAGAKVGNDAANRSHATKSLSGNRHRRQQQRPRASAKHRLSRMPSLSMPWQAWADTACFQPPSSLLSGRYRHSTVPNAASCVGDGNGAVLRAPASVRTADRARLMAATSSRLGWPTRCGQGW